MGTVDVFTKARMQAIENNAVVSGAVVGDNLILTQFDGDTINAGNVRGPTGSAGAAGSQVTPWDPAVTYASGAVVGYAGRMYRALLGTNLNKSPWIFQTYWTPLSGQDFQAWVMADPYFGGDSLLAWETFWKTGTATVALSTTAGDFETMGQALQINLSPSSGQRIYEKLENIVQVGEVIEVKVRAKLASAVTGCTIDVQLLQNSATSTPSPLASGVTTTAAAAAKTTTATPA